MYLPQMAAYAMTGNSFIHKLARSLVAKNMLNKMGVSELKTFTGSLKTGRMKWPFYRPEKEMESSSQRPSQGEDLSAAPTRPYRSIEDLRRDYLNHEKSPSDVASAVLKRAKALNEAFHFMVQFQDEDKIMRAAAKSAQRYAQRKSWSKLDGIPFIVKDEMSVAGFQELVGTNPKDKKNPRIGKLATRNDPVIQALIDAGAILFGTSVMHEYGISPVGFNVWAQGPLNAYDPTRYTGGSSSGPATGPRLKCFSSHLPLDSMEVDQFATRPHGLASLEPWQHSARFLTRDSEVGEELVDTI
ncbi:conserved hypothetical protein [Perkinsus marinus ATCC 50983]|uniref:Amidase domain-containing protein n=1 Tax=Perkinsus marinus (strain ATCC 50983 / TXsc) TaxID=423536 RepID=C5LBS3_PERM5|nr:conserved hypothetical protein [Perkinsus marinus ATCC 50983]EER05894.1 conserved hypothetical protein [Perkinsus marinus ATCC 50983]|eukprot:XP_002774078.1 conserved hypothetical protein [Perkinsus marinus ATCC 50983]